MRFEFKNFARAGKGNIELNDLTVICGPNNTGKTYINYAIFSILNNMENYIDIGFTSGEVKKAFAELNATGSCELKISAEKLSEKKLSKGIEKKVVSDLHSYFGLPADHFSKLEMSLSLDNLDFTKTNKNYLFNMPGLNGILKLNGHIILSLKIDNKDEFNDVKKYYAKNLNNSLNRIVFREIVSQQIDSPFSITSERTGIAMFYRIFDEKNSRIIRSLEEKKNSVSELISERSDLAQSIHQNIIAVRNYPGMRNQKSKFTQSSKKYQGILALHSDLLDGGEFHSTNDTVFYVPNEKLPVPEPPTPLHATSSSLKSLFLLDLFIKHIANDGQILVVDEPELNLFPLNQAKMARLIAKIVNAGIKVLVTSHSDYFVREINNLIALKNVKEDKKTIMDKYGFEEDEILDYESVSAYNTTKEYVVEKMKVDKFGIENKILDSVIENVNEKNNEILFSVEEE